MRIKNKKNKHKKTSKARENTGDQVTIDFSLVSDWFLGQTQSKTKQTEVISDHFLHSIETCSYAP